MAFRGICVFVLLGAAGSLGATHRTANFVVEAPSAEVARQVGEHAERCRKDFARKWLGEEMPAWKQPCPLRVTVTMNGSGGATSFAFDGGKVLSQDMHVEGTLERLLASVLPHEVTHTVFAYHFRTPVPRWADEGASILSEDETECARHEQMVRQILRTPGRAIRLRTLFRQRDYPRDVMVLYAEGYSISRFLVKAQGRKTFLAFVGDGMRDDWDRACAKHYSFKDVEALEKAWWEWVLAEKPRNPEGTLARRLRVLEAEEKLLGLEKKLLKKQLARQRQIAGWEQEQEQLEREIDRARRAVEKLRREGGEPEDAPAAPAAVPVPVPAPR